MVRLFYYVVDNGRDWEVRAHDATRHESAFRYSLQEDAVAAAAKLAHAHWRLHSQPTGVRLQAAYGGWEIVRTYGESDTSDAAD